jgi:hypothetical protein
MSDFRSIRHHMSKSPTWWTWVSMMKRCSYPKDKEFKNYGGRGISICRTWRSFEGFHVAMGDRPEGTTLDRIDRDGHYVIENCRWSTNTEQVRNRSNTRYLEYKGQRLPLAEWSDKLSVSYATLIKRHSYGWSSAKILETPIRPRRMKHD